ncbi:hypothetical protein ACOXXX_06175 [Thalassococcus sp. BH17M4-6]
MNSEFRDWAPAPEGRHDRAARAVAKTAVVSIVIPCLSEESVLDEVLFRLHATTVGVQDATFEFIFVDDGSTESR